MTCTDKKPGVAVTVCRLNSSANAQTIILFQDTSLVYAIGAYDLLKGFSTAGKIYGRPEEAYLLAAVVYFVMCFGLSYMVKRLQTRIAIIR